MFLTKAWRPTRFIRAAIYLHIGLPIALIFAPQYWLIWLSALIVTHLLLMAVSLWPRSTWSGANLLRMPPNPARKTIYLTIDDGPDPALTPQVLALLTAHQASASFFCIGEKVRQHPAIARAIVAAGHGLENHSEHHWHRFSILGPRAMHEEVAAAQHSIRQVSGKTPHFFRAPAGLRNPFLDWVLHQEKLQLASWTRRGFDTRESNPDKVFERLTRNLADGDILLLHDANTAHTSDQQAIILAVLPRLLAHCRTQGYHIDKLPPPHCA